MTGGRPAEGECTMATTSNAGPATSSGSDIRQVDAVVIGAGFSGLYLNYRLRDTMGLDVAVIEAGSDVGGTWYWNRYPGARCDSESYMYCFAFDRSSCRSGTGAGKYPEQPEILRYLSHVADRFDLRRNIEFNTRVTAAHFDEQANRWTVETDAGERFRCRYLITGIGCLSTGQIPDFPGRDTFAGEAYHTGSWPHEGVDFAGKRVAVIGTGSSGVQSIPVIASQAEQLHVFQRTAQYMIPARHATVDKAVLDDIKQDYDDHLRQGPLVARRLPLRRHRSFGPQSSTSEERADHLRGGLAGGRVQVRLRARSPTCACRWTPTELAADFIRNKIRETVDRPGLCREARSHRPSRSGRSGPSSTLTTSRPTTGQTSPSSISTAHRITEITPTGMRTSAGPTTSTSSCTPPDLTR